MASSSQDREEDDHDTKFRLISVEGYLTDVLNALDPCYRMTVTEQHRKKMVRCLMGYHNTNTNTNTNNGKADFEAKLQSLYVQQQWEQTAELVVSLKELEVDKSKAPNFHQALQQLDHKTPAKFFSFLARGRFYQGKFERLLQDVAPHLVPQFLEILQEPNHLQLMQRLVREESNVPPALQWKDRLLELIDKQFVHKGPNQPQDGGKQMGKKGELNLESYLKTRINTNANTDPTTSMVLSNVLVKPPQRHLQNTNKQLQQNNPNKRLPYVLLSNALQHKGMTTEFDCLVIQKQQESIHIQQLWEAKACFHPIAIQDALQKKIQALERLLKDEEAAMYFDLRYCTNELKRVLMENSDDDLQEPLTYPLSQPASTDGTQEEEDLVVGMFGMDLLDARSAARRTQSIACEAYLERSPQAVIEALDTGQVKAPRNNNDELRLHKLLQQAKRWKPVLVVPATASYFRRSKEIQPEA